MTSENRLLLNFAEVLYIRFECKKCEAVFSIKPHEWKKLVYDCRNCGQEFMHMDSIEEKSLRAFLTAIEDLRKIKNDRFLVQFEIKAP